MNKEDNMNVEVDNYTSFRVIYMICKFISQF